MRSGSAELSLALSFTDRYVDLVEEGIDVAIRIGALQDSSLIARRVTQTRFRIFGAPSYFANHGRPRTFDDLAHHNCLPFTSRETRLVRDWRFRRSGADFTTTPRGNPNFSDGAAICAAVCAGYGLAQMHDHYGDAPPVAGALEPVLVSFELPPTRFRWSIRQPAIYRRRSGSSSISSRLSCADCELVLRFSMK
ncbi:substrate binding domain-containing protein [Bradyrhizobium sp.]|uniref:substrate binding domain-containing protein n=1 Tax=Bradyrhizobium sp. TaxID=376 RepID=UPI003BB13BC8